MFETDSIGETPSSHERYLVDFMFVLLQVPVLPQTGRNHNLWVSGLYRLSV